MLQDRLLFKRQRYDGIDIQAKTVLDFLGVANTARQFAAKDGQCHAGQQAEHQRKRHDQRFLRLDRPLGFDGRVEQPNIADLAFFDEAQLQGAIEKRLVELAIDADVTLQPQGVALYGRHSAHASVQAADLMLDGRNLTIDHADLRVGFGEACEQLAPLLLGLE
ncbi:hypothetical protein D9M72_522050 [compost metagenome]